MVVDALTRGYIGIMEKKMETTIWGSGVCSPGICKVHILGIHRVYTLGIYRVYTRGVGLVLQGYIGFSDSEV